ncbi:MAG: glycosyltransferase family 4 protein [Arenicellales bacterium]
MMKITLFDSMIGSGGAERVLTTMANELVEAYDVSVVTFQSGPEDVFYEINNRVDVRYLDLLKKSKGVFDAIRGNLRRIKVLRQEIKALDPDVIVSFLPENNILVTLSCLGCKKPIILSEHTDPIGTKLGKAWDILRQLVYRKADTIVVLTSSAKKYFESRFRVPVVEIPNPVYLPAEKEDEEIVEIPGPYIITIGRLVKNKRAGDIISAFSQIKNEYMEWRLVIVGDGPLKEGLLELARKLGVGERVIFTGLVRSPERLLKNAEMFVSASITEVFPMAICEAMVCGVPVIVREYSESVKDIIVDKKSGVLVKKHSQESLVTAIKDLMDDQKRRKELGLEAKIAMRKFAPDVVMSRWIELFQQLTRRVDREFEQE